MRKNRVRSVKYKKSWISVALQDHGFASNVALNIYKSRRAQRDWFNNRKNRRARRAAQTHREADTRCLALCARLVREVLNSNPGPFIAYPELKSREPLLRYLERWGFRKDSDYFWIRI